MANLPSYDQRWCNVLDADGTAVRVMITVDWERLIDTVGRAAVKNKTRKAIEIGGAVRATASGNRTKS